MAITATINAFVVELKPRDVVAAAAFARGDDAATLVIGAVAAEGASRAVVVYVSPPRSESAFNSLVVVAFALTSSVEAVSPGQGCCPVLAVSFAVSVANSAPQPGQAR
jgi:hypothetical protein